MQKGDGDGGSNPSFLRPGLATERRERERAKQSVRKRAEGQCRERATDRDKERDVER